MPTRLAAAALLCWTLAVCPPAAADEPAMPGPAPPAADAPPDFFDTRISERRILLVLDHSKSMQSSLDGQTRLARLRDECDRLFERLDEYHYLDVHCFNDHLAVWRRKLEPCSDEALAAAREFIHAQLARGRTATYDALQSALVEGFDEGVQRIIFVTDGEPTVGTVVNPAAILRRLKVQNARTKIPIDVIAFDTAHHPARAAFLRRLAADHDGRFVPLD